MGHEGGANWLLDEIVLAQRYQKAVAAKEFQVWTLTVNADRTARFNKLVPSPANVRKTGALTGIEELAASIAALRAQAVRGNGPFGRRTPQRPRGSPQDDCGDRLRRRLSRRSHFNRLFKRSNGATTREFRRAVTSTAT